jgi:hypothetical protein
MTPKVWINTPWAERLIEAVARAVSSPQGDPEAQVECVRALLSHYGVKGLCEVRIGEQCPDSRP